MYDSNKKLVMEALSTIGGVASAMGPAVEKASKVSTKQSLNGLSYTYFGQEFGSAFSIVLILNVCVCDGSSRVFFQMS